MGTSIYWYAEKKNAQGQWEFACADCYPTRDIEDESFTIDCNYRLFSWLGGERDYFNISPIAAERAVPEDALYNKDHFFEFSIGSNSLSWVAVSELVNFNYDATYKEILLNGKNDLLLGQDGVYTPPIPIIRSYREAFGAEWFIFLDRLIATGASRMIFGFD